MKDIEQLLIEIAALAKDKGAKYYYGVEYSNDQKLPAFKAYIGFTKEGVQPLYFTEPTKARLKKRLQKVVKDGPSVDVYIKYHEAIIEQHEQGIRFERAKIKEYENTLSELPTE